MLKGLTCNIIAVHSDTKALLAKTAVRNIVVVYDSELMAIDFRS